MCLPVNFTLAISDLNTSRLSKTILLRTRICIAQTIEDSSKNRLLYFKLQAHLVVRVESSGTMGSKHIKKSLGDGPRKQDPRRHNIVACRQFRWLFSLDNSRPELFSLKVAPPKSQHAAKASCVLHRHLTSLPFLRYSSQMSPLIQRLLRLSGSSFYHRRARSINHGQDSFAMFCLSHSTLDNHFCCFLARTMPLF